MAEEKKLSSTPQEDEQGYLDDDIRDDGYESAPNEPPEDDFDLPDDDKAEFPDESAEGDIDYLDEEIDEVEELATDHVAAADKTAGDRAFRDKRETAKSREPYAEEAIERQETYVAAPAGDMAAARVESEEDLPPIEDAGTVPEVEAPKEREVVISLNNVSKRYTREAPAVSRANLEIREGEFVFITGETGSGKSTLLKLIMHELKPTDGQIRVLGYNLNKIRHGKVAKFRRNLGIVFQDFRLLRDRNVYENVAFAQRIIQVPTDQIRRNVTDVLDMVGMADKYKRKVTQLSGGEQQRVALARAIVNKPFIMLADEPTGNLDADTAWEIMQLIDRINTLNKTTVIVVTHDRTIVDRMHKRVIEMKQGEIIRDTPAKAMAFADDYDHEYQDIDADGYN